MSRAVNVTASHDEVVALCDRHGMGISTIETLVSGGTRVVLDNMEAADEVRRRMKAQLIGGAVVRSAEHIARIPVPFQ